MAPHVGRVWNNLVVTSRRSLALTLSAVFAVGIVAASEVALSRAQPQPRTIGPADVEIARRATNQFRSDVDHGRGVNPKGLARLLAIAERGGAPSGEVFSGLYPLERTEHRATVLRLARHAAHSRCDREAYVGIELLRWWHQPDWRALALSHEGEPGFWFRAAVEDARSEP